MGREDAPPAANAPVPEALCPEGFTGLKVGPPKVKATGLPAVLSSMAHALGTARGRPRRPHAGRTQPEGRLRLPELRLARPGRPPGRRRVLRERREGRSPGRRRQRHRAASSSPSTASPSWPRSRTTGTASRAGSPSRWCCGPARTHYEPIAWDDAFTLIAEELNALAAPDEAVFYTSGRTSNEAAFLYQLFVPAVRHQQPARLLEHVPRVERRGARPRPSASARGRSRSRTSRRRNCIFIIGQNPGTNHPRMLTALQKAKRAGREIVAVNPLPEAGLMAFSNPQEVRGMLGFGTPLADLFLQVRINGDVALLQGDHEGAAGRGREPRPRARPGVHRRARTDRASTTSPRRCAA